MSYKGFDMNVSGSFFRKSIFLIVLVLAVPSCSEHDLETADNKLKLDSSELGGIGHNSPDIHGTEDLEDRLLGDELRGLIISDGLFVIDQRAPIEVIELANKQTVATCLLYTSDAADE